MVLIIRRCANCGREFRILAPSGGGERKYCCVACRSAARQKARSIRIAQQARANY